MEPEKTLSRISVSIKNITDEKIYNVNLFDNKMSDSKPSDKLLYSSDIAPYNHLLNVIATNELAKMQVYKAIYRAHCDYKKFLVKQLHSNLIFYQGDHNGKSRYQILPSGYNVMQQQETVVEVDADLTIATQYVLDALFNIEIPYLMPETEINVVLKLKPLIKN